MSPETCCVCAAQSPNLLVDAGWRVKVADFGLTKAALMDDDTCCDPSSTMQHINPCWLAPEIIAGDPASKASDVYALGIVMWEVLTWAVPWRGANGHAIAGAITAGERPPLPGVFPGLDTAEFRGTSGVVSTLVAAIIIDLIPKGMTSF
jgi:serine/threonine protein kinase